MTDVLQSFGPEAAVLVAIGGGLTVITALVGELMRLLALRQVLAVYERCRSDTSDAGRDISRIAQSLRGGRRTRRGPGSAD